MHGVVRASQAVDHSTKESLVRTSRHCKRAQHQENAESTKTFDAICSVITMSDYVNSACNVSARCERVRDCACVGV